MNLSETNFTEAIKPLLDKLSFEMCEFTYWEDDKEIISDSSFAISDSPLNYKIIIRLTDDLAKGHIILGGILGDDIDEEIDLGDITYQNGIWKLVDNQ